MPINRQCGLFSTLSFAALLCKEQGRVGHIWLEAITICSITKSVKLQWNNVPMCVKQCSHVRETMFPRAWNNVPACVKQCSHVRGKSKTSKETGDNVKRFDVNAPKPRCRPRCQNAFVCKDSRMLYESLADTTNIIYSVPPNKIQLVILCLKNQPRTAL